MGGCEEGEEGCSRWEWAGAWCGIFVTGGGDGRPASAAHH